MCLHSDLRNLSFRIVLCVFAQIWQTFLFTYQLSLSSVIDFLNSTVWKKLSSRRKCTFLIISLVEKIICVEKSICCTVLKMMDLYFVYQIPVENLDSSSDTYQWNFFIIPWKKIQNWYRGIRFIIKLFYFLSVIGLLFSRLSSVYCIKGEGGGGEIERLTQTTRSYSLLHFTGEKSY